MPHRQQHFRNLRIQHQQQQHLLWCNHAHPLQHLHRCPQAHQLLQEPYAYNAVPERKSKVNRIGTACARAALFLDEVAVVGG